MTVYQPLAPNPNWPKSFTFSPGVRVGNFIFLSRTTATDDKGVMVGKGDIVVQTRQIFRKFAAVLELAGVATFWDRRSTSDIPYGYLRRCHV